jgi:sulfoxide reductase heme-binding subunit YedZ
MNASASFRRRDTLGVGGDWRRRLLLHHLPVALASGAAVVVFMGFPPFTHRSIFTGAFSVSLLTVATGYVATALLALTLLVGPANLLLRKRNPVSSYLRRDLGTWTVILSVVHVVVGFQVRGDGAFRFLDFFVADGRPLLNSFGLGNWTGLAALVLVAGLLAISTNRSMSELKAERWKSLQRLNYTVFALVVLHAVFYGALTQPTSPFTVLLLAVVAAVLLGQGLGIWLHRRRRFRRFAPVSRQGS